MFFFLSSEGGFVFLSRGWKDGRLFRYPGHKILFYMSILVEKSSGNPTERSCLRIRQQPFEGECKMFKVFKILNIQELQTPLPNHQVEPWLLTQDCSDLRVYLFIIIIIYYYYSVTRRFPGDDGLRYVPFSMQCIDKNKNSLTRFIKIRRGSCERVSHNRCFLGFNRKSESFVTVFT